MAWCGQCFAPVPVAPTAVVAPVRVTAERMAPDLVRSTRWGRSATTFGPVGRVIATFLLLVPVAFFFVAGMFWAGGFIWIFIVVPWALRDIWRRARIRTR